MFTHFRVLTDNVKSYLIAILFTIDKSWEFFENMFFRDGSSTAGTASQ